MSGTFPSRAPWKRSACDRCRAQKLRCHRDEQQSPVSVACFRCLKSQVECRTSEARPTGRPPSRHPPRIEHNHGNNNSQHNSTSSTSSESSTDMTMIGLDHDISLDTFLDNIRMQHTDFNMDDHLLDNSLLHHQTTPSMVTAPPAGDPSPSQQQAYPYSIPKTDPIMPAGIDDIGFLLSKLHYELSEQLYYIRSAPWDVKSALHLSFSHKSNGDTVETSESHPLVQVSKASTELEELLAGFALSGSTDHTSLTFSCSPSSSPRISTTQLLTVLSCYIHIVSLYDIIFSKVLDYLIRNSKTSTSFETSTPKIYLGGLAIAPYQTLPGSLLVHLTEHRLQPIEKLMGLPDNYRVSSKFKEGGNGGSVGLFGDQNSHSLLNAVIQLGEERDGSHDGVRCIRSLKMKMRQIKEF